MKRFKKRTLALVLASVVTVAGSFGAENYKNSLMNLSFEAATNSNIKMSVETRSPFTGNITPKRISSDTYVLMLPEINSEAPTPKLENTNGNVSSVNIRTMPYSNNSKGYTRITIKLANPSVNLSATHQIFTPKQAEIEDKNINNNEQYNNRYNSYNNDNIEDTRNYDRPSDYSSERNLDSNSNNEYDNYSTSYNDESNTNNSYENESSYEKNETNEFSSEETIDENRNYESQEQEYSENDSNKNNLLLFGIIAILFTIFCFIRAKSRLEDLSVTNLDIDLSDDKEPKKNKTKLKQIKKTIKTLDKTYQKTYKPPRIDEYSKVEKVEEKNIDNLNIVDLDELFKEHQTQSKTEMTKDEEENLALEEFLSGFSFDESLEQEQEQENKPLYNEELYNSVINNENINFSKKDINCIKQLLNSEINNETMQNIEKYAVSNPIKIVPTKKQILEKLVTEYTISQNISFNKDDIDALYKIISVELDNSFITDLRTNPQKSLQMEKDILSYGDKPKKPSEIVTLSVKDMLPDLSEALKKQGNKKIESNYKSDTVYFSEGYEYKKLAINEDLPNLSLEINKKDAYKSKPSAEIEIVDKNYSVGNLLKISSELPDLSKALANSDEQKKEPQKVVADEKNLLENLSNVAFKPFYDGTNQFEVLNDVPSVNDIKEEFSQFENFEITNNDDLEINTTENSYDDFESLYSNEYFDLDKTLQTTEEKTKPATNNIAKNKPIQNNTQNINNNPEQKSTLFKCIIDNETYTIISSTVLIGNIGCHLAKNENGYTILGYVNEKIFKIKHYKILKSEKIQSRMSEKLDDGTIRYIVRIGINKFIVNVKDNNIEYVMDLC